ncbi:MAG TPA: hypothetical protein VD994_11030, partial [Prosthecobacter sp.]|nr:hypothetical protein [Prosthecobacter sp.]
TYDVRIEDAGGKVLARAEEVQSPWLVETDLPAGASLSVHLRATGKQDVATRDFRVAADAAPLAPNLKEQMEALAAAGRKADALMLLMRLPEGAVPEEEWVVWRKRLTGG